MYLAKGQQIALEARPSIGPERRAAISASLRGVPKSPEHRAKIAAASRRRGADPAYKARMRALRLSFLGRASCEPATGP